MKVKILKTGDVTELEDGYAARLIEQGAAVPAPAGKEDKGKGGKKAE